MRTAASAPYPARAIVLRARPMGEKDRVLDLFGPGIGRWSAVARGARGAKSKLGALAQPFVCARLLLAHGRSLDTLTQGEIENAHFHIPSHGLGAAWAFYWCEVAASLPERHPEDDAFDLLQNALGALDLLCAHARTSAEEGGEVRARMMVLGHWFEARFLALLGFPSIVGMCAQCEAKISVPPGADDARVAFSPTMGGTLCAACERSDPSRLSPRAETLRLLHRLERLALPSQLPTSTSPRAEGELRALLRRSLGVHLDIKPRSRRFLDDLSEHSS